MNIPRRRRCWTLGDRLEIGQGNPGEARKYLEKALKIREDTFGKEHLNVAGTLGKLAALETIDRYVQQGRRLLQAALDISEKVLGGEPSRFGPAACAIRRFSFWNSGSSAKRRRVWTGP